MSYTALYRKYRPDTFDEVKGQDHIVTTLRNQIKANRIGHAYLFCGTRGTGKTSVAKIFARAVNCSHPENGNPCGVCENCLAAAGASSVNVIEIDAASNNGVDNVRQIREEVAYSPTSGRYKVYIIDEVHMLSPGAFNALLKTLEEPPEYVIFILATTEAHKIPVTILSRCQRYDFRRISPEEIALRLRDILEREGVQAEEKAVQFIARKADGGMRDALSLTDQTISFYLGEELTYEKVLDVLGAVDTEVLGRLYRALLEQNVASVLSLLDDLIFHGRDLTHLAADFTEYLRDLILLQVDANAADLLDVSGDQLALLQEEAAMTDEETLLRFIRIFSELGGRMRYALNRRVMMEIALIRICRPQMESDTGSLAARIARMEKLLEEGYVPASKDGTGLAPAQAERQNTPPDPVRYEKAVPEDLAQIRERWKEIAGNVSSNVFRAALKNAELKFDTAPGREGCIFVVVKGVAGDSYLHDKAAVAEMEEIISDKIGKTIEVRFVNEKEEEELGLRLQSIDIMNRAQSHINFEIETEM